MMIQLLKKEALVIEINQFKTVRPPARLLSAYRDLHASQNSLTRQLDISKNNSNHGSDDQSKSGSSLVINLGESCRDETLMRHGSQYS